MGGIVHLCDEPTFATDFPSRAPTSASHILRGRKALAGSLEFSR